MRPDFPLVTERMFIRPFQMNDLDTIVPLHAHPDLVRYLYWGARSPEQVLEVLEMRCRTTAFEKAGDNVSLAAVLRTNGAFVGEFNLRWTSEEHQQGEIGYLLHPDFHGRGLATEGARAMLHLGFDQLKLHRVAARLDGRNTASARVLERLGMRKEAHLVQNEFVKGEWTDDVIYAMLAEEWHAR